MTRTKTKSSRKASGSQPLGSNNRTTGNGKVSMPGNKATATMLAPQPTQPKKKSMKELELDRLVWGDDEGFHTALKEYKDEGIGELMDLDHGGQDEAGNDEDMAGLDDSQLFFLDAAPDATVKAVIPAHDPAAESNEDRDAPAWVDSDDERLAVSLASTNRLRKLRRFEGEDVISGVEYTRRLQQQFEMLYPAPEWAASIKSKGGAHRQKRRRLSASGSSSDDVSDDEEEEENRNDATEIGDLTTTPLAQLLQSSAPLVSTVSATDSKGRIRFRPESLDIQRTKDVKSSSPSTISSLCFHPTHPVLLSAGPSGLLTLHQISPRAPVPNPTLTSLAVQRLPIATAAFSPDGTKIYFSARRRFFHSWHLAEGRVARVTALQAATQNSCERLQPSPCGRFVGLVGTGRKGGGVINVLDAASMHWRCSARVEGRGGVADFAWWDDGDGFVAVGRGGAALEYSVVDRRPLARWHDEGLVQPTLVTLGGKRGDGAASGLGGDRWVVVGTVSGVVSMYDRTGWRVGRSDKSNNVDASDDEDALGQRTLTNVPANPKPIADFQQLTTPASHAVFSPCGQILAISSRWKRDAMRLVHVASRTVYPRWPTSGTPLGRITAVAWGHAGEDGTLALVVGNEQGKVRMWEVRG